jgi:hypothetical protein
VSLPPVVEIAIGLVVIYAAVSVFCSGVNELIAERVGRRGRFLREGLLNVINDRWMYLRITTHPVVWSLYRDLPGKPRPPSYIPAAAFSTAAIETILLKAAQLAGAGPGAALAAPTFANLRDALVRCRAAGYYVADALLPLVDAANGDLAVAKRNIEGWYDGAMERVSGWYKRRTRWLLFVIGLAVAVLCNVDTVQVVTALSRSATLRGTVASMAEDALLAGEIGDASPADPAAAPAIDRIRAVTDRLAELEPLGLPVGFSCLGGAGSGGAGLGTTISACWANARAEGAARWPLKAIGWLLTALAVSLGAPFWWQLLSRLVDLRGAGGKPR